MDALVRRLSARHDVDLPPLTRTAGAEAEWWLEQAHPLLASRSSRASSTAMCTISASSSCRTYYRWYQLTRRRSLNEVLVQAGQTLALRFKEKGQYLRSFVAENSLFIDIMMNVGIIFYAARETGDRDAARYRHAALPDDAARAGARRRLDGARGHLRSRDGRVPAADTHQGYRGDSCWSRGLAWALYGFGTCYEYSRDPRFLETAEAARTTTSRIRPPTACRRGISTRPPRAASRWIRPRRPSRRRVCSGCAVWSPIR